MAAQRARAACQQEGLSHRQWRDRTAVQEEIDAEQVHRAAGQRLEESADRPALEIDGASAMGGETFSYTSAANCDRAAAEGIEAIADIAAQQVDPCAEHFQVF